ncbi:MAG TPA: hypothetical protein VGK45_10845 [Thermoanaerobaculia bacterium]
MAHLVLNDVAPEVIEALRLRSDPHRRPIEEEAKTVLEEALGLSHGRSLRVAQGIRSELAAPAVDSAQLLREGREGHEKR